MAREGVARTRPSGIGTGTRRLPQETPHTEPLNRVRGGEPQGRWKERQRGAGLAASCKRCKVGGHAGRRAAAAGPRAWRAH
eukprot:scaffold114181_cov40-Tisochrysis_lutea.AAC.3